MISDFSQKIQIRRITPGEDHGFGGGEATETTILSTWSKIEDINRASAVKQALDVEVLNYKITIRYSSGREIKQDDIVAWNGNRYKVTTSPKVIEIDKKKFLETFIVREDG